jgi:FkbM family methyltransferase
MGALGAPTCLWRKLRHPRLVSYGLLANLLSARRRGLITAIDAVIDVGANVGQYAYMAHYVWPHAPVYSFEPDPVCYTELQETFLRHGIPGSCFQLALGERCDERPLKLQSNRAQSSFLSRDDVPGGFASSITVRCTTLDSAAQSFPEVEKALLKIDTQGFEAAVLRGATNFLRRCAYIQLEVAFRPSYAGQPYAAALLATMRESGFICIEILDILRERRIPGSPVAEADLLFARLGTDQ